MCMGLPSSSKQAKNSSSDLNLNLLHLELLDGAGSELSTILFAMFLFISRYGFYLVIIGKLVLNKKKIRSRLGGIDKICIRKSKINKAFEGLSIEFLSIIYYFENFSAYI